MYARHGTGGRHIDPAQTPMRNIAPQYHRMQHAVSFQIVDKTAGSAKKPEVFDPMKGFADQRHRVHRVIFPACHAIA
jgi:hypothetical protein